MRYFRRVLLSLVISLLIIPPAAAQAVEWVQTYAAGMVGKSVQQTTDGGYVVAGWSHATRSGNYDVCLLKTDSLGNKIWSNKFGGTAGDGGESVQQTADGGYIIVGWTASYGAGYDDVWLIKTDSMGNEQWDNTFGGASDDRGYDVQQTTDGGYIIVGYTWSKGVGDYDVWLIKTDSSGNKLWDKTFGDTWGDSGNSIRQTTDGGYIIAGTTTTYWWGSDYPDWNVWLIKTDSSGNMVWDSKFNGGAHDFGDSVQQTTDGGYVIAGSTDYEIWGSFDYDVWLIKTDSLGNMLWDNSFSKTMDDSGRSVQQTTDGGYIIAGCAGYRDEADAWLIKTDSSGNKLWDETVGGPNRDEAYSVQQTTDGGYIATGGGGAYLNLGLGKTFGPE